MNIHAFPYPSNFVLIIFMGNCAMMIIFGMAFIFKDLYIMQFLLWTIAISASGD